LPAGALFLNWLLLFPFAAAVACAVYPRLREARHSPAGSLVAAAAVPAAMAAFVALLLALVAPGGWPMLGEYRWTSDLFQFRLRFGRLEAVFLLVLCWQVFLLAERRRAMARVGAQPLAAAMAREAAALCILLGILAGAVVSRDLITMLFFWQASALPTAWLAAFSDSAGSRQRVSWSVGFLLAHFAGSIAMLAAFAVVWARTQTTDPFAAGMNLVFRAGAPERAASLLLFVGLAAGMVGAAALAARLRLIALAAPIITVGGFLLLRTWQLLFSEYALGPASGPLLWVCSLAACCVLGASVVVRGPGTGFSLIAAGQAAFCLFAVAASGLGRSLAGPAAAYLAAVGLALPVLAVLAESVSEQQERRRGAASGQQAATSVVLAAVLLALLPVPWVSGGQSLLEISRGLWRGESGPVLVVACAFAVMVISAVLHLRRSEWVPASRGGWQPVIAVALAAALALAAVTAAGWGHATAQQMARLTREGG
jgi:hypothetical protein